MLCVQHKSLNWVQYWLTCTCLASQGQARFLLQIQWRCLSGSFPQDKLDFWSGIKYSWRLSPWPTIYRSKNLEVLIEGSVFKSLDLGHYISWSFFFPWKRHPRAASMTWQYSAVPSVSCYWWKHLCRNVLIENNAQPPVYRAWSHILRITPKLHRNIIQLPWKHFCLSSQKHCKVHSVLPSMHGPIPGLHKQNWIKLQGVQMVQMPLCHIFRSTHTLDLP